MVTVVWGRAAARREKLERELDRLVPILRGLRGVVETWVFGSMVSGEVHASSDVDLLVVRETDEDCVERLFTLKHELEPRVSVDLFVYTPGEVRAGGRFVDSVVATGRRLW